MMGWIYLVAAIVAFFAFVIISSKIDWRNIERASEEADRMFRTATEFFAEHRPKIVSIVEQQLEKLPLPIPDRTRLRESFIEATRLAIINAFNGNPDPKPDGGHKSAVYCGEGWMRSQFDPEPDPECNIDWWCHVTVHLRRSFDTTDGILTLTIGLYRQRLIFLSGARPTSASPERGDRN